MQRTLASLFIFIVFSLTSFGQLVDWTLDCTHSSVSFSINYMVFSEVIGNFKDVDIRVVSTEKYFADAKIQATIKTASINTDNERRDNHLRSDDFFSAEQFPEITFTSSAIEKMDDSNYKIHGDLTIRGVTKRVTFDATHNGTLKTGNVLRAGWKAATTINRFDYGLRWNRALETGGLVAGESVRIVVDLQLTQQISS
jgi:polyisoprenoid-binding protein YceI